MQYLTNTLNLSVKVRHQLSSTTTQVAVKDLADDDVNVETKQEMLDMDDNDAEVLRQSGWRSSLPHFNELDDEKDAERPESQISKEQQKMLQAFLNGMDRFVHGDMLAPTNEDLLGLNEDT